MAPEGQFGLRVPNCRWLSYHSTLPVEKLSTLLIVQKARLFNVCWLYE